MVRPDDVAVSPSASGCGVVVERSFQGAFYLYRVALDSGLVVHSLGHHTQRMEVGERVEARLDPAHPPLVFRNGRAVDGGGLEHAPREGR